MPVSKEELEEQWCAASEAVSSGNYGHAAFILRQLADKGEWVAFSELGNLYEQGGEGLAQDFEQALYWYRRAIAEADAPHAHLGLARMYFYGTGVPPNRSQARTHCIKALAVPPPVGMDVRGRILAILILGRLYRDGVDVPRDVDAARRLYEPGIREELPAVIREYAQLEFECGHPIRAARLLLKAIWTAMKLAYVDRQHPKLVGVPSGGTNRMPMSANIYFLGRKKS